MLQMVNIVFDARKLLWCVAKVCWRFCLDLIFPESEEVKLLRKMSDKQLFAELNQISHNAKNKIIKMQNVSIHYSLPYKNPLVKEIIWQIKFRGQKKYCKILGKLLAENIAIILKKEKNCNGENYLLIPVPIHEKRRKERGFNQCEFLCEEIIREVEKMKRLNDEKCKLKYAPKILMREIYQEKQSWSDRHGRFEKISGVFTIALNNKTKSYTAEIINEKIILIDDVVTTGSTLSEISKVLFNAGTKKIIAVVVAH